MTKIPITPSIIKQVHALAVLDEMPEGLKIPDRAKNVIFDTAWITGVDYDKQEFDDDEYDKEEEIEDNDDDDQRAYILRVEATSPTVSSEAIITAGVIDAKQRRDVMTLDIQNAFLQTKIALDGDKIIMKIRGQLIDILLEICPGVYNDCVINEGKHKILYVRMLRALYGMLVSSILYYKKFRKDIRADWI
jgi:hypothetical protein